MTNNYAVRITHDEVPHIFCVTDSQATNHHYKQANVPKLLQYGHNLVMHAGRADVIYPVHTMLRKNDVSKKCAQDLAEMIESEIDALSENIQEEHDPTSFL